MKNILLIGGEGYIGNVLSTFLLKSGYKVTSFDRLIYNNGYLVLNNVNNKHYKFIYGDMVKKQDLEPALDEIDTVVLLAGLVGDPITKKYPQEAAIINELGIRNSIDLCVEKNIDQLIFISTCSNYGLTEDGVLASETHELQPLSLYAKAKTSTEEYILSLIGKTKMNPTILRFATAFGLSPRMRFDLTISEFTRELMSQNELLIYDANTWRPYCHVKDFARLIKMVIEAPVNKVSFEVFNAGGDSNNATKQTIVNHILKRIPNGKVKYLEKGSDPRNYRVNFVKVQEVLGFTPKYSIEQGIDELIQSISNHVFDNVLQNQNLYGNYEIEYSK